MSILRTLTRAVLAALAVLAGPFLGAWAADSPDPASTDDRQVLIRKHIAAHATEAPHLREEARQALVASGEEGAKALIAEIERTRNVQKELMETLARIRNLDLTPDEKTTLESIRKTRLSLEVYDQPLWNVIELIQRQTNVRIAAAFDRDAPISIRLEKIPLDNALNLITEQAGYVWYCEDHLVKIMPDYNAPRRRDLWIRTFLGSYPDPRDPDILAIQNKLDTMTISIDFQDAQLLDVVEFVHQFSGLNLVIDPELRNNETIQMKRTALKVMDVPLSECLTRLMSGYGLSYSIRERVVYISRAPAPSE